MAYVRTVKTSSGATAVQIVHSSRRGSRNIEHLGSAHDEAEVEALKPQPGNGWPRDQRELDLGIEVPAWCGGATPLPIISTRMAHLWDALNRAYDVLGFEAATDGDEVFRHLVLARIIEPSSKQDSLRVLEEVGMKPSSYATLKRRLAGLRRRSPGAETSPRRALPGPRWVRRVWCSTTSPRSYADVGITSVYADLLVMPMLDASLQVSPVWTAQKVGIIRGGRASRGCLVRVGRSRVRCRQGGSGRSRPA